MSSTLRRLLCTHLPKKGKPAILNEIETNHALSVLRLRDGESVIALDGSGHAVQGKLVRDGTKTLIAFENRIEADQKEVVPLILELAMLKGDAMEWAIEKAVELGAETLIPLMTERTIVQTGKKGPEIFQERWQKIADQALKQCGRLQRLEISAPIALTKHLTSTPNGLRLWCDENDRGTTPPLSELLHSIDPKALPLRLLIGPEGGWSDAERALISPTAERISLGPLILRAETAALFATALVTSRLRTLHSDTNT